MNGKGIRVLVIDDDIDFQSYVYDLLLSRGFEVFKAINGEKGMEILKKEKIDVVITDMIMPEREGVETIMEIKIKYPDMKIIAISGAVRKETYLKLAEGLGAHIILPKPFKKQELFDAIENVYTR